MSDRKTTTIVCEDCGQHYETIRKNTKFCALCRLLRDLQFQGTSNSKCAICDQRFAKINRRDAVCGNCNIVPSSQHGEGDCALCGATQVKTIRKDLAVCVPCAYDPDRRLTLIRALSRKVQSRRQEVAS